MNSCELELLQEDIVVRVIPLQEAPISLGRNHGNTLVLLDETISGHHAIAWLTPDGPHLTDLHSKNGTFLNDEQITSTVKLSDGDSLRLGENTHLRVRSRATVTGALVIKDLTAGMATLLDEQRCIIGAGPDADIRLMSGPDQAAVVVVHENQEAYLHIDETYRQIEPGDTFEVGDHSFKLETFAGGVSATRPAQVRTKYPYSLAVRLMGDGGPAAIFKEPGRNLTHTITSENRVALLYVLARKRAEEVAKDAQGEVGWCSDDDVMQGIWGRAAQRNSPSGYSVLLFRIRKELESAGFDPWFLEKRRGATRLALNEVTLL